MPDIKNDLRRSVLPPSQPASLIGGHFRAFWRHRIDFLMRQAALGDVGYLKFANRQMFFVNHPDHIRDMLVVNAHKFIKGRALQRAKSLFGEGLLTSEGEFHLRQRRMIQPAFHRSRIEEYSRSMVEFAERTADRWHGGAVLDIDKEMMHLTLQIVAKTLFNADISSETDKIGASMTTLVGLFDFLVLPFSEWLEKLPIPQSIRSKIAITTLDKIIYEIINERRRSGKDEGDLLSMLLLAQDENGSAMSDQQVRDECLTLFLAGHETTANALTWTWYLLSQDPNAEKKLHNELDRVLSAGSNLRVPTFDDLPNLKYTEAVLAESMRLFPPAWAIGRIAIENHEFSGYVIPRGAVVLASPYVLQRDKRFWGNAEEFIPERWETQSVKEAGQKNIYFPFGGGVRRCIGESFAWTEGILVLATIARKWKFSLEPDQKVGVNPQITLRPKHGMKMKVEERVISY
jgi:cytochrome P450